MSIERQVVEALKTKITELCQKPECGLEIIQENTFHLHTHPPYFVKFIPDDDRLGKNEIWVNQTILNKAAIPSPALAFSIKISGATIVGWEWLEGDDLRYQQRSLLPQAFAQLGYFHAQQRHTQPVFSLVTQRSYDTIQGLLEDERAFLTRHHDEAVRQHATTAFALFEKGFATYIHGDMHPGNIRITEKGLKFVDWGYCTSSLNLFDLGYIRTINFNDPDEDNAWWWVTPEEARLVLPAYFQACGSGEGDYAPMQQAVMFWSRLWAYDNCIKQDNEMDARKCKNHIARLMSVQ